MKPSDDIFFKTSGELSCAGQEEMWRYMDDFAKRKLLGIEIESGTGRSTMPRAKPGDFGITERAVRQRLEHLKRKSGEWGQTKCHVKHHRYN